MGEDEDEKVVGTRHYMTVCRLGRLHKQFVKGNLPLQGAERIRFAIVVPYIVTGPSLTFVLDQHPQPTRVR
jgi:hypothetical protein